VRLLITADLHFAHPRSEPLAVEIIDEMNRAGGDVLLVIGDTATGEGDALERGLAHFRFDGPKLFVAGNHELWTRSAVDTYELFTLELPARIAAAGWHWLQHAPFVAGDLAIVGSVGWYDYSYAEPSLGIDRRFYEAKLSPGVAARLREFKHLIHGDESPAALDVIARWNDGKFVRLGRSDEAFLGELLVQLDGQLTALAAMKRVICAIHHVPFAELLPPRHGMHWDFARAYLGSGAMGDVIAKHENVSYVFSGHSHSRAEATIAGRIKAINIGSGYRQKRYLQFDVEEGRIWSR
jgi:3',5'-cyclic AMP phosphodiesterase CpdA